MLLIAVPTSSGRLLLAGSGPSGVGFGFIGHGHTNVYGTVTRGLGPAPNLAVAQIGGNCATYAAPNGAVH